MISVVEIDGSRRNYWDEEVTKFENVHPLNAFGWGRVRAIDGWSSTYLLARKGDIITGAVMILTKYLPLKCFSIMYAPRGPVFDPSDTETLKALLLKIRSIAKKNHAIFLRIDPNIKEGMIAKNSDSFLREGFNHLNRRWTFWNTPRDVYRLDLTKVDTEDELFKSLEKQARKKMRKARKEGVIIQHAKSLRELDIFYEIFKKFTISKGFMSRSYVYQKSLWDEFITQGRGKLFLAVYQGKIIGGSICLAFGRKCLAMHMGTPSKYKNLCTNDALTWESIRWAKEKNFRWYSFRGVGSTPSQERFKRKFRPEVVSLVGYYDLAFHPLLYRLFYTVEFEFLPRMWSTILKSRRIYNDLSSHLNLNKSR